MTPRPPDRRRGLRGAPDVAGWRADAVLRPGLLVRIVNIGPFGALVECHGRLRPGRRAELQLVTAATEQKEIVLGLVERCQVVGLAPLSFQGAIVFDSVLRGHLTGSNYPMARRPGPNE